MVIVSLFVVERAIPTGPDASRLAKPSTLNPSKYPLAQPVYRHINTIIVAYCKASTGLRGAGQSNSLDFGPPACLKPAVNIRHCLVFDRSKIPQQAQFPKEISPYVRKQEKHYAEIWRMPNTVLFARENKMFRVCPAILILCVALLSQGCATLEYLDGSSEEEIELFRMTKGEIWNEKVRLQRQVQILTAENERIRNQNEIQVAATTHHDPRAKEQTGRLAEDIRKIAHENRLLETRLNRLENKTYPSASLYASREPEKPARKPRVQVLSGVDSPGSASDMKKNLGNLGYDVEWINCSTRSTNSFRTTVYYTPGFQGEAKRLAQNLGGYVVLKPSSWNSLFHVDLIVMTPNRPRSLYAPH